ncbi:MAG: acyltransferase family protein [Ilumatobacteraceae bacterium]
MALSTAAPPQPSPGRDHPRAHIAALDGLRGLAVIAVLFFHAGKLRGGFLGVDLFFALSGFLITSLLLTEVDASGRVRLVAFWGRRFRRLLPAVLLLLVVVTVITTAIASVPERAATLSDGPWAQAYIANWHAIAGHRDYWASFELPRMFGHLWSLAIEEQFYLVWPVIVGIIAWRSRNVHRTIIVFCVAASAASLAWMIILFEPADPTRVYIGTDTRASSLLLGALFAAAPLRSAVTHLTARLGGAFNALALVVVVTIGLSWFMIDGPSSSWLFRGGLFAHSLLSAVLVAVCAARPNAPVSRWIGWGPLPVIGVLSYSLYLWHWPVYALLSPHRTGMSGWELLSLRFAVSFAAAAISKVLIEDPVRFRATWARSRAGIASLAAITVAIAAFWVSVPHPETAPAVFSLDQFASTTAPPPTTGSTQQSATTASPTSIAAATQATTAVTTTSSAPAPELFAPISRVLMTGDSVAFDEWPAVAAAMYAGKIAIGSYVSPGAGLLDTKYQATVEIDKMVADFRPDLVLYQGSLWDFGTSDEQRAAYERFADYVISQGARLAFITIPPMRSDQEHLEELGSLTGIMNEVAGEHPDDVIVLNTDDIWGPNFVQDSNSDKVPERKPDGVHVCPSGAAMYAIWLMDELEQRFEGFTPVPPSEWATGNWVDDPRYTQPSGICAALS